MTEESLEQKNNLQYSETNLITINPTTPLSGAIALMSQNRTSCLLIESEQLEGIFTERDLVKLLAQDLDFHQKTIAEVMTPNPTTILAEDYLSPIELTSIFQQHQIRHLPLVNAQNKVLGVITHSSLRKTIEDSYLLRQKKVQEVMNHQVVHCTGELNLMEVVKLLISNCVSCIVVIHYDEQKRLSPLGIITERDIVQFKVLGVDFYSLRVDQVMSSPLLPIKLNDSLQNAHKLMLDNYIRRLVVVDHQGVLVGIITQTSILKSLNAQEISNVLEVLEDLVDKQTKELRNERTIIQQKQQELILNQNYLQHILKGIKEVAFIVSLNDYDLSLLSSNSNKHNLHQEILIQETYNKFKSSSTKEKFFAQAQKAIQAQQKIDFQYCSSNQNSLVYLAQIFPLENNSVIWLVSQINSSKSQENIEPDISSQADIAAHVQDLKTVNKLLQQQITQLLNYSVPTISNSHHSWLQFLLPINRKLGSWFNNLQHRQYSYPAWTGALITLMIALIIDLSRRRGILLPVPFLLLIISVSASATLGGIIAGLWSNLIWALFVIYAAIIGFGPKTLTGSILSAIVGILVMTVFAIVQGWNKEQNRWLTQLLINQNRYLELGINNRTKQLGIINSNLKQEIEDRIASQQALAASENKFRVIFEQAEVGIVVASLDKHFLEVNPKFCQFTGYSEAELKSMTFEQITHPEEKALTHNQTQHLIQQKSQTLIKEKRYIRKNGETIWGHLTATVVQNQQGKPAYFISIVQDITKRKRAELALQESKIGFCFLLNQCPFLIWIADIQGQCNFFNAAWLDFTGKTLEQEKGIGWLKGVHPDDATYCLNTYQQAFAQRERFRMEYRLRKRNGEYAWILDDGIPRYKSDGSFAGYIGTCLEISDRIKARQEREQLLQQINQERTFLKAVLQQMPAGVIIGEPPSGKTILSNYHSESILKHLKKPLTQLEADTQLLKLADAQLDTDSASLMTKVCQGEVFSGKEYNYLSQDGIIRTLLVNGSSVRNDQHEIIAGIITLDDISVKKQAEVAKQDAKNKSILLKEIHHRIKNNLQVVSALLDLQSEQIQDKSAHALLEKSQTRIQTMALIHEKLYSSQKLDRIDFVEYVTSLAKYLVDSFVQDAKQIKLSLNIKPIQLSIDLATPCGLIINELIVNALEHGFPNQEIGKIKIFFDPDQDILDQYYNFNSYHNQKSDIHYLIVEDNGLGLAQEIDINNTSFLGLSLVKSLVEQQLKGNMEIINNHGCTIKITFPDR